MENKFEIKVNEELAQDAEELFGFLGLDLSSAVNIYLAACLRKGGIPFHVGFDCDCGCDCDCDCGCDCDCDCDCDCECDEDCNCGCQEGKGCTCGCGCKD